MGPKKGGGGGNAPAAAPTKTFNLTVSKVFDGDKLENFLAASIPFISKTKIGKGINGKNDKESKQPQLQSAELHADGKKIKMKMPAKVVDVGNVFTVTVSCPPKDIDAQLAAAQTKVGGLEEEQAKLDEAVEAQLNSVNAKIEESKNKPPKNSWMHKPGGARAQASGGESEAMVGHTVGQDQEAEQ